MISERQPQRGEVWRRYDGQLFVVTGLGTDKSTGLTVVVCREINTSALIVFRMSEWEAVVGYDSSRQGSDRVLAFEFTGMTGHAPI